jgi:hypothetical protein
LPEPWANVELDASARITDAARTCNVVLMLFLLVTPHHRHGASFQRDRY